MYNTAKPCNVKNFFAKCKAFTNIRKRLFNINDIKDLFENINMNEILPF